MTGNRHDHRHFDLVLHLQTREDSTLTRSSEESNSAGKSKNQVGWIRSALYKLGEIQIVEATGGRSSYLTVLLSFLQAHLDLSKVGKHAKKLRIDQLSTLPCKTS